MVLIITVVAATAAFFIFAIGYALKAQKRKVTTGMEGLMGQRAAVFRDIENGEGHVMLHGEIWRAICDVPVKKGEKVRVIAVDNLTVKVEKI